MGVSDYIFYILSFIIPFFFRSCLSPSKMDHGDCDFVYLVWSCVLPEFYCLLDSHNRCVINTCWSTYLWKELFSKIFYCQFCQSTWPIVEISHFFISHYVIFPSFQSPPVQPDSSIFYFSSNFIKSKTDNVCFHSSILTSSSINCDVLKASKWQDCCQFCSIYTFSLLVMNPMSKQILKLFVSLKWQELSYPTLIFLSSIGDVTNCSSYCSISIALIMQSHFIFYFIERMTCMELIQ